MSVYEVSFSPDIILSDWLGSKHQLTNYYCDPFCLLDNTEFKRASCFRLGRGRKKHRIDLVTTLLSCEELGRILTTDHDLSTHLFSKSQACSGTQRIPVLMLPQSVLNVRLSGRMSNLQGEMETIRSWPMSRSLFVECQNCNKWPTGGSRNR